MGPPFRVLAVLLFWSMTTGAHLDVLQLAAWARMWSGNLERMSAKEAVVQTLAPENRCALCHTVAEARGDEKENDPFLPGLQAAKALLFLEWRETRVHRPSPERQPWRRPLAGCTPEGLSEPATPPPRAPGRSASPPPTLV